MISSTTGWADERCLCLLAPCWTATINNQWTNPFLLNHDLFKPQYLFLCLCCFLPAEGSSARLVLPGRKKKKNSDHDTEAHWQRFGCTVLLKCALRWRSSDGAVAQSSRSYAVQTKSITQTEQFSFLCQHVGGRFYDHSTAARQRGGSCRFIIFFGLTLKQLSCHSSSRAATDLTVLNIWRQTKQVAAWGHQTMCFTSCRAAKHLKPQISKQNIFINPIWLDKTLYNAYICIYKYMYTYIYILNFSYKKRSTLCFIHKRMYRYRKVSAVT